MEIQMQKTEILLVHGLRNETANKAGNCGIMQMPAEGRVISSLLSTTQTSGAVHHEQEPDTEMMSSGPGSDQ